MIRQRQGGHPQGLRPFEQTANRSGAVQQAVMAMTMQMGEGKRAHGFLLAASVWADNCILPPFITRR
jgi:hypothetical protein